REITTGAEAREGLYQQVPNPVRWTQTIGCLADRGVERWFEAGAGAVLSGLLRSIVPGGKCVSFGEAKDIEKLRDPAVG
ncbi:MAG: malonyl CoA-acyl carrier protein transacylase, partial [Acidobacteriota bacterium]|nr:malonyl CoA-acyl carrier protein transacylase [Acidobacteriota bacterium]